MADWFTLASVIINAVAVIIAPIVKKKIDKQNKTLQTINDGLVVVSETLKTVETAVEESKNDKKNGAGNKVTEKIKELGTEARTFVDSGRNLMDAILNSTNITEDVLVKDRINQARKDHEARMAILLADQKKGQ